MGSSGSNYKKKNKKFKVSPLTFGAWNVCTLMDKAQVDRPERRKALVGRELARYNADIAALSKTRLAEEGQLNEIGAGCTLFWSGSAKNN